MTPGQRGRPRPQRGGKGPRRGHRDRPAGCVTCRGDGEGGRRGPAAGSPARCGGGGQSRPAPACRKGPGTDDSGGAGNGRAGDEPVYILSRQRQRRGRKTPRGYTSGPGRRAPGRRLARAGGSEPARMIHAWRAAIEQGLPAIPGDAPHARQTLAPPRRPSPRNSSQTRAPSPGQAPVADATANRGAARE